jgi:hypothetical protein
MNRYDTLYISVSGVFSVFASMSSTTGVRDATLPRGASNVALWALVERPVLDRAVSSRGFMTSQHPSKLTTIIVSPSDVPWVVKSRFLCECVNGDHRELMVGHTAGGVVVVEQGHVEVDAVAPDAGHL